MSIFTFILGLFIGMILMAFVKAGKMAELESRMNNAESRAVIHFRKLLKIEHIIKKDEENHEFVINTMKKIKEIIASQNTDNF